MVLDANGNLGVGVDFPESSKLHVNGNIAIPLGSGFGFGFSDKFTYDSKTIGNYSLNWVQDTGNSGAATAYLSSFGGIKLFTSAQPRLASCHRW